MDDAQSDTQQDVPELGGWARYVQEIVSRPRWSVARLARESGVHRATIFNWLNGTVTNVSAKSVRAIATAVGDDPDAVILTAAEEIKAAADTPPGEENIDVWEAEFIRDIRAAPDLSEAQKWDYEMKARHHAAEKRALDALHARILGREPA
jgi:transcriptional regulator with XRE-family HTH domain